jgi:hypothetical protein
MDSNIFKEEFEAKDINDSGDDIQICEDDDSRSSSICGINETMESQGGNDPSMLQARDSEGEQSSDSADDDMEMNSSR